jgi:hypothetical protein
MKVPGGAKRRQEAQDNLGFFRRHKASNISRALKANIRAVRGN